MNESHAVSFDIEYTLVLVLSNQLPLRYIVI